MATSRAASLGGAEADAWTAFSPRPVLLCAHNARSGGSPIFKSASRWFGAPAAQRRLFPPANRTTSHVGREGWGSR